MADQADVPHSSEMEVDSSKPEATSDTTAAGSVAAAAADFSVPAGAVDISPTLDGGVMKVILKEGVSDERPAAGEDVFVHYTGTLTNGEKFDSSRDRDELFKFKLGQGSVIKAWDIGVATMKKGEVCRLICRSDYAYGASGSPPKIGADATLIFEIELFYWKGEDISEDKDESIIRRISTKGEGYTTPKEEAQVEVHLVGRYGVKEFENRNVKFVVGEGTEQGVIEGIDVAIRNFKKGEKSKLTIKPKLAFGSSGNSSLGVPPNATVEYEVTLVDFEKVKETWEMDPEEKLSQSDIYKEKGTDFFKAGKFKLALNKYNKVLDLIKYEKDLSGSLEAKKKGLLLAGHLNAALCYLKLNDFVKAKEECTSAIELDSKNEKAFFRRGQAYMGTHDWELAKSDFQNVLNIDPSNKTAKTQVALAEQKIKDEKDKQKKIYGGMFQKFAERDTKLSGNADAKSQQHCKPDGDTDVQSS